ncbi:MAG TPA: hypothetical protein VFG04_10385 [Planctomycetaceae bacterium]|nr:hypothetical protein [Planctomycetaceae bacterium]
MQNRRIRLTFFCRVNALGTAALVLVVGAQASRAQLPVNSQFGIPASKQINNPVVSPFLNLAQPGLDPGVAYQTLIAPQLQLGAAVALQQQQIGVLQQATAPVRPATTPLPPGTILGTGHPTVFMNTQGYFFQPNLRR